MGKEGCFDLLSELISGSRSQVYVAQIARGAHPFAMIPRAKHDKDFSVGIVRLQRGVLRLWTPHIFLVPPAADFQCRYGDFVQMRLHSPRLPIRVIAWVLEESLP